MKIVVLSLLVPETETEAMAVAELVAGTEETEDAGYLLGTRDDWVSAGTE